MASAAVAQKAERKARKLAQRVKELEAELAEAKERAALAEQAAADQHTAMARQDHVHADQIAALTVLVQGYIAKVERMTETWEQLLKKAGTL